MLIKERIRHDNVEIQSIIPIIIVGPIAHFIIPQLSLCNGPTIIMTIIFPYHVNHSHNNDHHNLSLFPSPHRNESMGAAWQRPTVGDFVLVSGHGELSRLRRWGQLFADDGEQEPALDGYGYGYGYIHT